MTWCKRSLLVLAATFPLCAALPVHAQNCEKRILVVGYSPGGTGDIIAQAVAGPLSRALKQPVVVEHHPGGSGGVAARWISQAKPDGCTLLVGQTAEIAVNPAIVRNLGYDPMKDLRPVALLATASLALVVPRTASYNSVADLVSAARKAKPAFTFSSAGRGTPGYFAGELFRLRTRTGLAHIAFNGGGEALDAVLSGRSSFYFPALPTALQMAERLRILAVSSGKRSPAAPDIPTLDEAGLAPFDFDLWVGLFAPRGTPDAEVEQLNRTMNEVLLQSDVKAALLDKGATAAPMNSSRFKTFIAAETNRYATLIENEFCSTCPW